MVLGLIIGILYLFKDFFYWAKFTASFIVLWLKKYTGRRRFDLYDFDVKNHPEKLGILVPKEEIILESPIHEEELQNSSDEIFIYGISTKSEALLVRIARDINQESEAWVYLKLDDGKWYHLEQAKGFQRESDGKCTSYTCGGLKMYQLSAMRRWRISFCGILREENYKDEMDNKDIFVKFTFVWTASSDVYDMNSDMNIKATADAMANAKWKTPFPPVERAEKMFNSYCQSGVLNGTVTIEDEPEKEMYLFGERIRYLGDGIFPGQGKFKLILGVVPETGLFLHLEKSSVPYIFHNFYHGFVVNPCSKVDAVQDGYIVSKLSNRAASEHSFIAMIKTEDQLEIRGELCKEHIEFTDGQRYDGHINITAINFEIDENKGSGFIISGDISTQPRRFSQNKLQQHQFASSIKKPLTVSFDDEESCLTELCGGKGASLGRLRKLSKEMKTKFTVPKGIVVTTEAYNSFLTRETIEGIEKMKNVVYGISKGKVHESCKMVQNLVECTTLQEKLRNEIESKLKSTFGSNFNKLKFAVRSSATGEDSDQMSAAGQMETFLGVRGLDEIFMSLKKCWASQFSFIAIEYKRQNGQILNSPMAVVIQEMVDCEVSGVLFTCDPVTNNPCYVVITGNYGLGETVVSGLEEPDTIVLQKSANNELQVKNITVGLKERKVVLNGNLQESGTVFETIPEDKKKECCLSENAAINLGKLSLKIEKYFKTPRDIEWGIKNNIIYILQSRPITTGETISDFEIKHELDGPLRCEGEYFTMCNVGEVQPGAMSPLGFDVLNRCFSVLFQKKDRKEATGNPFSQSKYYPTGMLPFYNHQTLAVMDVLTLESDDINSVAAQGMMISLFGRILDDPDIIRKIKQRKYPSKKTKIKFLLKFVWNLFFSGNGIGKIKEDVFRYQIPQEKLKRAKELFNYLMDNCSHTADPFELHMNCSTASSLWNMLVFSVLASAKGGVDSDVYSDFAKLLASSMNVESADIPSGLELLSQAIMKDIKSDVFKSLPVEEAQAWLETSPNTAGIKYREFIKRHGHRCLKETDIYSIPWNVNPKPLIKMLQNMCGHCDDVKPKKKLAFSEILPSLTIPLNLKSRLLLQFILPHCRRGIRNREMCKSTVVKSFDNVKKGFRRLSQLMVFEGYLPDAELMFFLTIDELKDLLETRNPKSIARAKHRKKLHPYLEGLLFPEISKGRPVPINEMQDEPVEFVADLAMKGIPVSQGTTKGFARVAISLEEAADLKPGEILITHSTDIGWSPYFPILAGVVTELGGLISHGAVVSREYGLPCVVGLHGATRNFMTGDYVLLDGNKGILQRLPQPEK